jgi:transcription antitermination factor NusG
MTFGYYVAFVRGMKEFHIARDLLELGVEAYAPSFVVERSPRYLRGKSVRVTVPLYPRYMFIREGERERIAALAHKDIIGLVRFGDVMAIVPFRAVRLIKRGVKLQAQQAHASIYDEEVITVRPDIGDRIAILTGLFEGGTGAYLGSRQGKARVVLSREGKEFTVDLPFDHLIVRE